MSVTLAPVPLDADMERALHNSAKKSVEWRTKRDELIREAHREGAGVREIARAVGLTHPAIIGIVLRGVAGEPSDEGPT